MMNMDGVISTERKQRIFVAQDFVPDKWENIETYFKQLLEEEIHDSQSLRKWLQKRSELESILSEDAGWRYIRMTCDTTVKEYQDDYTYFVTEIQPKIAPYSHKLNEKVINNPFRKELSDLEFEILFKNIEKDFKIFREENIPLNTKIQNLSKEFGTISGAMTVTIDGKEMTLQQAAVLLESTDRDKRQHELVPILNSLAEERKSKLAIDALKPWDKAVDPTGKPPLVPFKGSDDLVQKTIQCFNRLDPFLGDCIKTMNDIGHLDLESKKGKAPGGYNYPLSEIGVPFIFMNATSTLRDMVTILHEGGHAVHSIVTRDLELVDFRHTPSEVAELASMSMELISMDHWDVFFDDEDELRRAKKEHLEQIIQTLPWVATIDKFQHWIYENPQHSAEERKGKWNQIFAEFSDEITNWAGQEKYLDYLWQKQLHLFEVPFYYIEYGFAQLGAIAVWKNFKEDPESGLKGYLNALKLGHKRSIPEIYKAANIEFNFSRDYISELIAFVRKQLESL
jgi:oligoendopeptidase F